MSSSIASACCRTAPAATPAPCIAISSRGCCRRSATAAARSGWCISRFPARREPTAPPSATTKREAERLIAASGIAYAILRPGFVVAPSAYGGSAMLRALAAFPLDLPAAERGRRRSSRSRSRTSPRPSPGLPARDSGEAQRRDMGPDAAAAGHARRRDRSIPRGVRHRHDGRASRCRRSCSISAPDSAISPTGSAGCRRCAPPRSPSCAAASAAIPPAGWPRPASCRRRIEQTVGQRPPPSRTNGSPGCS